MENDPLDIIDRETISRLLSHCADTAKVITEPFGDTMHDLASRISATRQEQAVKLYTEQDLRHVLHMAVLAATAHKGQMRQTGASYFEAHLVGTDLNLIEEVGRTRVSLLAAGLGHDLKEDTAIDDKDKFRDAWKGTFKDPNDSVLAVSEEILDRTWRLITSASKMEGKSREITRAKAVRKILIGFSRLGFDVVHLKAAGDRLDNMRTLGVKNPSKQREIAEETYDVYCRIGDIIRIQHYVRTCVDLCASVLNPDLSHGFAELRDGRMEGHLSRIFSQTFNIRDYLTHILGHRDDIVNVKFDPARLADFVLESDEPLSRLSLSDLDISSQNPLFEIVVLVQPGTDVHSIITYLIRNCAKPGERRRTEDANPAGEFPKLGTRLIIHSRQLGILIFRINDTVSEARSKRGASPFKSENPNADDRPSDDTRAAVRRILHETEGNRVIRVVPLARELLLRPTVTVFTPRGDPKSLPKRSCGLDFAAVIHPDFLRGFDAFISHDSERRCHEINPFDPLEDGMQIEIVRGEKFLPDSGWYDLCKTEQARVALGKILPAGSHRDYLARLVALFGLPSTFAENLYSKKPLHMLAEKFFQGKKVWQIRVTLPDQPGILRQFLGEFEKQKINVNRFTHIPRPKPASHIVRMTIEDPTGEKTPFEMMEALLKLSYHYDLAVLPRNFFQRTLRRAGDFLSMVRNTLERDVFSL